MLNKGALAASMHIKVMKKKMIDLDLVTKDLSKITGVSIESILRYIRTGKCGSLYAALKISDELGLSIEELFFVEI